MSAASLASLLVEEYSGELEKEERRERTRRSVFLCSANWQTQCMSEVTLSVLADDVKAQSAKPDLQLREMQLACRFGESHMRQRIRGP
jgi:hypothetical protein